MLEAHVRYESFGSGRIYFNLKHANSNSKSIRNCGQRPNSKTIRHNTDYKIRLRDLKKKIAENYTQINSQHDKTNKTL